MICVIYAHPYPSHSQANRALLRAVRSVAGVEVRSLYDLYPDFDIDVAAEQAALTRARLIVWMHPVYWYSVPGLLKHWLDQVLAYGWAYGDNAHALRGKHCLWVATAGGDDKAYSPQGVHEQAFANFVPPIEETARFCGMQWEEPFVTLGSHLIGEPALHERAGRLARRLEEWVAAAPGDEPVNAEAAP